MSELDASGARRAPSTRAVLLAASALAWSSACGSFSSNATPTDGGAPDVGAAFADDAASGPADAGVAEGGVFDATAPARCGRAAPFGAPVPVLGVSTAAEEPHAQLTPDELAIYFVRYDVSSPKETIYMATRAARTDSFGQAVKVAALASAGPDSHPGIAPDRRAIFFTRRDVSWSVFVSRRADPTAELGAPQPFLQSATQNITYPYVHAATGELYVTVENLVGETFSHVARAPLDGGSATIVTELDAPGSSTYAAVPSADGLSIIVSSTRAGNEDLFIARRAAVTDPWEAPVVVSELSTTARELSGWISPDDCRFYFSSNRLGTFDVFVAERPR